MGTMRLPVIGGDNNNIDVEHTERMIALAMEKGVNYYDTAWGYHGGNSESVVGGILAKYPRDSFYVTTKFPGYDINNMSKVEEIFETQLKKVGVEYFDFYLIHNVCELNIDHYLDRSYGIYDYLMKQKANGRIKHLGFSLHGSIDVAHRFLEAYSEGLEFCQMQINWIDWNFQNAEETVKLIRSYGLPLWVMEPMRGGMLAEIPEEAEAKLKALRPDETVPGWAFRFLQSIPDATVVLTGASSIEQLEENLRTFETDAPVSEAEKKVLFEIAEEMVSRTSLPCTGCRYCTSHCPQELDIPMLLKLYNEHVFSGGGFLAPMRLRSLPEERRPQACLGCRSCESVCPQQIKISEAMTDFSARL